MRFEVENKFRVTDLTSVESRLRALKVEVKGAVRQIDMYFAHPSRDFSTTDEALRIRRIGLANYVTYKGPKIDKDTKTRREIELPIADGERGVEDWAQLFDALGFRLVGEVRKQRRSFGMSWGGFDFEGALDEVDDLGSFVELEVTVEDDELAGAKEQLIALSKRLDLSKPERRSYLELTIDD